MEGPADSRPTSPERAPEPVPVPGSEPAPVPVRVSVPGSLRHLMEVPELAVAWQAQVQGRRAEALKVAHLLEYVSRCRARCAGESLVARAESGRAAVRDAALLLGASERTTTIILNAAEYTQQALPRTWEAFTGGVIDLLRVRKIAEAATGELSGPLLRRLDARAAVEAARRSVGDFHRWLTRYIADLDPEAYTATCARTRQDRYVRFEHQSNGMSYLEAYLPTMEAAAIQKRLRAAARGLDTPPPTAARPDAPRPDAPTHGGHQAEAEGITGGGRIVHSTGDYHLSGDAVAGGDGRTLAQREADLLGAWLRDGRVYTTAVEAKIMVMIPEATLTGESQAPGIAADRSWCLPAEQARELAADPAAEHHWYQGTVRRNTRDADYDLLSARYVGRYPPARLRDVLVFRDGVCQAPGCTVAAEACDMDHQHRWQAGGQTTGSNLWALCRRHHRMKSHGHLNPPPPPEAPPKPPPQPQAPQDRRPAASAETALATATMVWASIPISIKT